MWRFNPLLSGVLLLLLAGCSGESGDAERTILEKQFLRSDLNLVVFFIEDCPMCLNAAPAIRKLQNKHSKLDVHWVYSTAFPDLEKLHAFQKEFDLQKNITLDTDLRIAKAFRATVTPEFFLLSRDGQILYQGLLDDYFVSLGKHKPEPTKHFLADAIEAAETGDLVAVPRTDAIGCYIELDHVPISIEP